jgi:hypothetical protein
VQRIVEQLDATAIAKIVEWLAETHARSDQLFMLGE